MPKRFIPFVNGEYYHIFNRGNARKPVFFNKRDYDRFLLTISYYRFTNPPFKLSRFLQLSEDFRGKLLSELDQKGERLVELVSFVFMPNHFHFLLKQNREDGISTFIRLTINSYTRYFNTKHSRLGALFQGAFKAVHMESEEQLLHLSRYIHLNPLTSYLVKDSDFLSYPWSSLKDYLADKSSLIETSPILSQFSSRASYKKFVFDQKDYARELEKIKHLILE